MSHFSVLVALSASQAEDPDFLSALLEPYNEGREVDPYPEQESWGQEYILKQNPGIDINDPVALAAALKEYGMDEEGEHFVEDGKLYRYSTYNPDSKWDYWRIGGRWAGTLKVKEGSTGHLEPLSWEWTFNPDEVPADRFDGRADVVRKADFDIDGARQEAVDAAVEQWSAFEAAVAEHGPLPNHDWREMFDTDPEKAKALRDAYWRHPTVIVLKGGMFGPLPSEQFGVDRDVFIERARQGAIPCYAYLDSTHGWIEPGRMGWFGMSNDTPASRDDYNAKVNEIVDSLPDDTTFVVLDCHI